MSDFNFPYFHPLYQCNRNSILQRKRTFERNGPPSAVRLRPMSPSTPKLRTDTTFESGSLLPAAIVVSPPKKRAKTQKENDFSRATIATSSQTVYSPTRRDSNLTSIESTSPYTHRLALVSPGKTPKRSPPAPPTGSQPPLTRAAHHRSRTPFVAGMSSPRVLGSVGNGTSSTP